MISRDTPIGTKIRCIRDFAIAEDFAAAWRSRCRAVPPGGPYISAGQVYQVRQLFLCEADSAGFSVELCEVDRRSSGFAATFIPQMFEPLELPSILTDIVERSKRPELIPA